MPKSIDGLMRYLRDKKGIEISGSAQKRKLRNIGYYHGYKGYRFVGTSTNTVPYTNFDQVQAFYDFDMRLKAILYPQLMFIETALKNYVLEELIRFGNSDNFNYIYTTLLTDHVRLQVGSGSYKDALKRRLSLRDRVYSALTREYDKNAIIQHFYHNDSSVPIWAIFEVLTLGEFGTFFWCLNYDVRKAVSKSLGLYQATDTDAFLTKKIIFAIRDLRNAVAHNDIVFDTRFSKSRISGSVSSTLEIETGIQNIGFSSIVDYVVLVAYLLKKLGTSKTDIKTFVSDIQNTVETFRASVPSNLFAKVVYTDTRRKLLQLKEFISC